MGVVGVLDRQVVELELFLHLPEGCPVWLVEPHPHELIGALQGASDLIHRQIRDSSPRGIGGTVDDWCGRRQIERLAISHAGKYGRVQRGESLVIAVIAMGLVFGACSVRK